MREWANEPDYKEFEHEGLKCKIVRQSWSGHLCGYVQVPEGHIHHGFGCNECEYEVHGGLTFAGTLKRDPDNWYFGFDCAHAWDICPKRLGEKDGFACPDAVYRNIEYVEKECRKLAEQIIAEGGAADLQRKAFMDSYKEIKRGHHPDVEMCRMIWDAAVAYASAK